MQETKNKIKNIVVLQISVLLKSLHVPVWNEIYFSLFLSIENKPLLFPSDNKTSDYWGENV